MVLEKDLMDGFFHVGKIHDHAVLKLSLNDTLDLIGVSVRRPAFRMTGQGMGAVDMIDDADLHGSARRIAQAGEALTGRAAQPGGTRTGAVRCAAFSCSLDSVLAF